MSQVWLSLWCQPSLSDQKGSAYITAAGVSLLFEHRDDLTASQSTQTLGVLHLSKLAKTPAKSLGTHPLNRSGSMGVDYTCPGAQMSTEVAKHIILAQPKPLGVPLLRLERQV